jgi:ABC-2 type transport system permease protein
MTSAGAAELLLGKLSVYLGLALGEFGLVLFLIRAVFGLSIRGPLTALGLLSVAFLVAVVGYGMFLSTVAPTRRVALLLVSLTLMPTTFLSGLLLPLDSLPAPLAIVSRLIPATWLIDASRGVILRGAGWEDLRWHTAILSGLAVVTCTASLRALRWKLR